MKLTKTPKILTLLLALGLGAPAAQAQTLIFGAGYSDFSDSDATDEATVALEYQHKPFHEATRFSAGWTTATTVDAEGDFFVGAGLYGIYAFNNRWFGEISVMPGYYDAGTDENDLGGEFQFRSLGAIGYVFDNGNRLSLAITHKSNASTNDFNPGVNTALIRFHKPF